MAILKKKSRFFRVICLLLACLLVQNNLEQVQAQGTPFLPSPNYIDLSTPYSFPVLRGMRVYPNKPFEFDFVVDSGNRQALDQKETSLLVKYFLTFLTIPEEDLWVNLSPYEKSRIIPNELALTNAGNTLLDQDKVLKQISSSLTYPETSLGKKFWAQVYKKAFEKYGTTDLPINTYNKVWIVPDKAVVYDMGDSAMVGDTHLKVMLEEDYLALKKNMARADKGARRAHTLTSEITKEIILPELQKEVNEGKNFAPVRQVFYSLVLADWFKRELKRNILSDVYVNKKKISGVNDVDKGATEKIYKQYLRIFKKGAYNYIREDVDPVTNQVVPRKYFSGGEYFGDSSAWMLNIQVPEFAALKEHFVELKDKFFGYMRVKLLSIGQDPLVLPANAAQLSKQTLFKVLVFVALSLGATVTAHGEIRTPLPDGKTQIEVQQGDKTFSDLMWKIYHKSLWGENGVVAKVGDPVKGNIQNPIKYKRNGLELIYEGDKFIIPTPGASSASALATAPAAAASPTAPVVMPKPASQQVPDQRRQGTSRAADSIADNTALPAASLPISQPQASPAPQQAAPSSAPPTLLPAEVAPEAAPESTVTALVISKPTVTVSASPKPTITVSAAPKPTVAVSAVPKAIVDIPVPPKPAVIAPKIAPPMAPAPQAAADAKSGTFTAPASSETRGESTGGAAPPPPRFARESGKVPSFTHNKVVYSYPSNAPYKIMQAADVKNEIVTQTGGVITGLNVQEKNYNNDTRVLTVLDQKNKDHIEELNGNISDQEKTLKETEEAQQEGGASALDVVNARLKLLDLQGQLANAKLIERSGVKKAPYNSTVNDFKVAEGDTVGPGTVLAGYYDRKRSRFDIEIPYNVYFQKAAVTIDGEPAESTFWFNWSESASSVQNIWVSFIVTPQTPISPGQKVKFHATFYASDEGRDIPIFKGRATTDVPVPPINEYTKHVPALDSYEFKVNQGDEVKRGQVMVKGVREPFAIQLETVLTQMEGEKIKLTRASFPNGGVIINRDEVDKINSNIRRLQAEAKDLQDTISHLEIRADQDGVVTWTGKNGTDVYQKESAVVTTNNNKVLLGDLKGSAYSIYYSAGVQRGAIVEGMAPAGPVLGEVTAVDPTPHVVSTVIGPAYSVEVTMHDPNHFLRKGMRFPLKLLTDKEKEIALATGFIPEDALLSSTWGAPLPPPPDGLQGFASQLFAQNTVGQFIAPIVPPKYYTPQGQIVSLQQVVQKVTENQGVLLAEQFYNVMLSTIEKFIPGAKKTSIFVSLYGGKGGLSGFGGASRLVNGVTSALTVGDLYNVGALVFGNVLGSVSDRIGDKIGKQEAVYSAGENSAGYALQTALAQQIYVAKVLYTKLGIVQQGIANSEALLNDLQEARRGAQAAEAHKLTEHSRVLEIDKEIPAVQKQIQDKEAEEEALTSDLNFLMGEKIVGGPHMVAQLTLTGDFPEITQQAEQKMLTKLLADGTVEKSKFSGINFIKNDKDKKNIFNPYNEKDGIWRDDPRDNTKVRFKTKYDLEKVLKKAGYKSLDEAIEKITKSDSRMAPIFQQAKDISPDPRLRKAWADLDVVLAEIKEEGLKKKPSLTVGSLVPNTNMSSLPYEPYGSGAIERGSSITGTSGLLQAGFDIKNQLTDIEIQGLAIQKEKADAIIKQREGELEKELHQTVIANNSSSKGIKTTQEGYQTALEIWEIPASQPGVYPKYTYTTQRRDLTKSSIESLDPKEKYLEQRENLIKMGVWDGSLVKASPSTGNKAQLAFSSSLRNFIFGLVSIIALAVMPLAAQDKIEGPSPETVTHSALRNNNPLGVSGDSNPLNRQQTLNLLKDIPNDQESAQQLAGYVLGHPSSVALEEIFRTAVERKDLPFFINVIIKGQGKEGSKEAVNLAYQKLGDIFKDYPEVLNGLYPTTILASLTDAESVLLTFIDQDPRGLGQAPFLYSNYLNTNQLARLYNKLDRYLGQHPNDQRIKTSRDRIRNIGIRRIFLEANRGHFTEGEIQNTDSLEIDINQLNIARGQIQELPKDYELFFDDPDWEQMGKLRPDLTKGATDRFDALARADLKANPTEKSDKNPLLEVPGTVAAQDSLRLFGSLDEEGQEKYSMGGTTANGVTFKPATNSELGRIVEARSMIKSPLLLDKVLGLLMASQDGRIDLLRIYAQESSDDAFRKKIEKLFLYQINTIKQDAKTIKNPSAMGIFRVALGIMDLRTNQDWIQTTIQNTYSSIKLTEALKGLTKGGTITQDAQAKFIALKRAIIVLKDIYPKVGEKNVYTAGGAVYSDAQIDLLNQIDQDLDSLNNPDGQDDYLTQKAAISVEDKEMVDKIIKYRDDILARMDANNQEIYTGPWWWRALRWTYHTGLFTSILLMTGGAAFILVPMFLDWKDRKFSSLEKLMNVSDAKSLNNKNGNGNGGGIDSNRVEPRAADFIIDWYGKLMNFSRNDRYSTDQLLGLQAEINGLADNILDAIPYTPHLMDVQATSAENQAYQISYAYFMKLANRTVNALADRFKAKDLTTDQQKRYLENRDKMFLKMIKVEKYLDILQGRVNVNTSVNEHFHKGEKKEAINRITTWSLGYDFVARKPVKKLGPDLRDLMGIGNLIRPGTYNDINGYVTLSLQKLKEVIFQGERFGSYGYAETSQSTRISSFTGRLLFLIPTAIFIVQVILSIARVIPFNFLNMFFTFSISCLSLARYWGPLLSNGRATDNMRMKEIMVRLYNKTNASVGSGEKVGNWKALKIKIVEEAKKINGAQKKGLSVNAAMFSAVKKEGGIDLNFQPQYIQRPSSPSPAFFREAGISRMPDGFKGFNFNIVRFTSELSVSGAFQMMLNSN